MIPHHAFTAISIIAETPPVSGPQSIFSSQFIMIGVMMVVFYVLLIRPQQRQRKEMAARIAALQSGDKVVTSAGIHGIVHNVKDHTVIIKVAEGTMLEFDKAAVASVHKKDTAAK